MAKNNLVDGIYLFAPESAGLLDNYMSAGLQRAASELLEEMQVLRGRVATPTSIVLIGHTFGGYILKQVG